MIFVKLLLILVATGLWTYSLNRFAVDKLRFAYGQSLPVAALVCLAVSAVLAFSHQIPTLLVLIVVGGLLAYTTGNTTSREE